MNRVNQRTVDRMAYKTDRDFYEHVGTILGKLAQDGYVTVFRYEDSGIYIIEYDHADRSYGCPYPVWLSVDDEERLMPDQDSEE